MQVLVTLAEHAGRMVPKDRLLASVWADTAVGDDVLTRAVSELRKLFQDDPKQPQVIETIPKAGYRLIAPVRRRPSDEALRTATISLPARRLVLPIAVASVLAIVVAVVWLQRWNRDVRRASPAPPQLVQLTSLRGKEGSPTFSPDGAQVAFSWNGEKQDNFDIYLKFVGSSEIRRVTTDSAPDVEPAWSPDGRQIAFVRQQSEADGGATIHLVSPLGGADRKLSDFRVPIAWLPDSCAIAWSPDGGWIAASRESSREDNSTPGIYLIPVAGGEPRPLTRANPPAWHVAPGFSADGRHLAYASCDAGMKVNAPACDVYVVDLGSDYAPVASPRRLTSQGFAIQGLAWTRDLSAVIYDTSGRGPFQLWRVKVAEAHAPPERIEVAGFGARKPATVSSRDRLAFERRLPTLGVYRVSPGQVPQPVLVSSAFDFDPQFSPDGQRVAFSSRRSGEAVEIWSASADGSSPHQVTRGPATRQGSPAWSPDGRRIAFESLGANGHWDVWLMDGDGAGLRQLTRDPGDEQSPTWSRDGRWIYFSSDHGGGLDIWRVPTPGGSPERVTHGGSGVVAYESVDGRTIVYQSAATDSALLALPLTGGPARQLVRCVKGQAFAVGGEGIYYAPCANGPDSEIHLLDAATRRDRVLASVSEPFFPSGLAVSPDGRTILVHRYTEDVDDLMLLEHFQ